MGTTFPVIDRFSKGRFVITAEQSHPVQLKRYNRLVNRGAIDAVTLPDIPLVGQIGGLLQILPGRGSRRPDTLALMADTEQPIFTLAAGIRSKKAVRDRVLQAAEKGARGLLVVSGGGLSRRLLGKVKPMLNLLPMDSFKVISLLQEMRAEGALSPELPIWAVENPYAGGQTADQVDRLQQKIEAGAEAILTQPPLLWASFETWWSLVHARGLTRTPILVGTPVITSVRMLMFWLWLVGIRRNDPAIQVLRDQFKHAEQSLDEDRLTALRIRWTVDLIEKIRGLPGVAGIHLMSMGGTQDLEEILKQAGLGPYQRIRADVEGLVQRLETEGMTVVREPGLTDDRYVGDFLKYLEVFHRATLDQGPFKTYWNRITYAQHFRMPVAYRPFVEMVEGSPAYTGEWELALDLLQHKSPQGLEQSLRTVLERQKLGETESRGGVVIGDYVPYSQSLVWQFNDAFWRHVGAFVAAHGRDYRDAIKGSPDANPAFVRHNAERFLKQLKQVRLEENQQGSRQIAYVEIGVASVDYVRTFIDALVMFARAEQFDLGGTVYVLADVSESVLEQAREDLGNSRKGIPLAYLLMNVEDPLDALRAYAGRILRVHITNVFDNLPNDKFAQIDGKHYQIQTRLYLPAGCTEALANRYGLEVKSLARDLERLPHTGVEAFLEKYRLLFRKQYSEKEEDYHFYRFWEDLYGDPEDRATGLKLEERYVHIPDLEAFDFLDRDQIPCSDFDPSRILHEVLSEYPHNVWMHLSNRAIEGGLQTLSLLHPQGVLEIVDIIVRKISDYHNVPRRRSRTGRPLYRMGFKGPAKFDGSAVDWFNGRVFEAAVHMVFPGAQVTYTSLKPFGKPHMSIMEISRGSG
ncbi:MAG: methylenetetrahydrofolate reductase [bacterium]|nr:methylenetetrahydrofolate reductase [bacterium]